MARDFGLELSVVSYHLNRVLAKECDVVELVETVPKRGSLEKVYRLKEELWAGLSGPVEPKGPDSSSLRRLSPGEFFLEVTDALDDGVFARLEGSAWDWFPVTLDDEAWKEVGRARRKFNQQLEKAVAETRTRGDATGQRVRDVVIGVAAFPTAQPGASS